MVISAPHRLVAHLLEPATSRKSPSIATEMCKSPIPRVVFTGTRGGTLTIIDGNGIKGFSGKGGQATDAALNFPEGLAVDTVGSLHIADPGNNKLRIDSVDDIICTTAGSGDNGFGGD